MTTTDLRAVTPAALYGAPVPRNDMPLSDPWAERAIQRAAEKARAARDEEAEAERAWKAAIETRDEQVRALYALIAQSDPTRNPSPKEIERATGVHEATVRAVTLEQRRALERTRPRAR